MPVRSTPTSIRLTPAEKRRIAAAARRRGLSSAAYIKRAALEGPQTGEARLLRLEQVAAALLATVEDELDAKMGDTAWDRHLTGHAVLNSREEFLRGVDL